jgi:hypothetical protein
MAQVVTESIYSGTCTSTTTRTENIHGRKAAAALAVLGMLRLTRVHFRKMSHLSVHIRMEDMCKVAKNVTRDGSVTRGHVQSREQACGVATHVIISRSRSENDTVHV